MEVRDAPSEAQSIDIEKWKREKNRKKIGEVGKDKDELKSVKDEVIFKPEVK